MPDSKLAGYLLSDDHPTGGEKARFFRRLGYTRKNAAEFDRQLLRLGSTESVAREVLSPYGTKYVVEGYLPGASNAPTSAPKWVRTVWIVEVGDIRPRLVTAYPVGRGAPSHERG